MYEIYFTRQAIKDLDLIKQAGLAKRVKALVHLLEQNPYRTPPAFEKLVGNLNGFYSRRINYHHRLIYKIIEEEKAVKIERMWTHYE